MDSRRRSNASTPVESESPISVDTPATESSVLFDNIDELLRRLPQENQYILVTGGLGFIGSHTTLELLKAGYNVIVIDNLSNSFEVVFDRIKILAQKFHDTHGSKMPSLRLHAHDYRDTSALKDLLQEYRLASRWGTPKSKIAGVIHFAAYKAVEESIRHPLKYYSNNVSGLIDFASTLGDFGIKTFIFFGHCIWYPRHFGSAFERGALCTQRRGLHRPQGRNANCPAWVHRNHQPIRTH
jgi:UDP-glucose 4-epimerase